MVMGKPVYDTSDEDSLALLKTAESFVLGDVEETVLMHFQVYAQNGFDPRVGWNTVPYYDGHRIDTEAYTRYDEFMSMAFFYQTGGLADADLVPTQNRSFFAIWTDYSTSPLTADTDSDSMPDGWEFYVMGGPGVFSGLHPQDMYSPIADYALISGTTAENPDLTVGTEVIILESDNLGFPEEWSGVECCKVYEDCPTIKNAHPEWKNKIWPTDPWATDTDGDGIPDGMELTWIFGAADHTSADFTDCVEGGGLNPLSWDTDADGLPDPWELEFAATVVLSSTTTTIESHSDTNGTSTVTNSVTTFPGAQQDGMNPTTPDQYKDYDHDGLQNWQEYMVGAMRCWRYDDVTSPWTDHIMTAEDIANGMQPENWDAWWGHLLLGRWSDTSAAANGYNAVAYNPGLSNGHFDSGVYFSCCGLPWLKEIQSSVYNHLYMFRDGVDHDLRLDIRMVRGVPENRWTALMDQAMMKTYDSHDLTGVPLYPKKYICCDPRKADTDNDGMDDFYEVFHGLNPLLGRAKGMVSGEEGLDIIYIAWGANPELNPNSATANHWIDGGEVVNCTFAKGPAGAALRDPNMSLMDFYQFPWLAGLPTADPDGDNIRNQQEAILSKVQAARTYQHTDPTPLWMTDTSFTNSLSHRFYQAENPRWANTFTIIEGVTKGTFEFEGKTHSFNEFPWLKYNPLTQTLAIEWNVNMVKNRDTLFSYEENEGYDSDHDYLGDFEESQGKTKVASDPQQHDDPIRHQAMWFNGTDAFLQTPLPLAYSVPFKVASSEARQDFLYYTVEAWVKPDGTIVGEGANGRHTVVERVIWTGSANAGDESYLRKNFLIGVNNGRWYTKFDTSGTDKGQAVEITDGPLASSDWTHVAATFGPESGNEADASAPMALRLYINGVLRNTIKTAVRPENGTAALVVNGTSELNNTIGWSSTATGKRMISFLVGASAANFRGVGFDYAWEARSEELAPVWPHVYEPLKTSLANYSSFFKGYVDEVRIWDGARSAKDIQEDYKGRVRYTSALAQENRQAVFASWAQGGLRSPSGNAAATLPPELRYHWAFDHVPGAVDSGEVLQAPAGFTTDRSQQDAMATWSRPAGYGNEWMRSFEAIRSKVYAEGAWVPWINNTVSHLPLLDGTTADSVYWSEDYAGYDSAASAGYSKFDFPRTAEVWSSQVQMRFATGKEPYTEQTRWDLVSEDPILKQRYRFANRNRLVTGGDLLPMGGAFPKRISALEGGMWDDGCPADAWAQTGSDADHNALPDWWEKYARNNYAELAPGEKLGWDSTVVYKGIPMTAWQAYLRDLAHGMLSDAKYHAEYADTRDDDKDGIPDWWEDLYGINTGSAADARTDTDHDGLSNLAEYRIEAAGIAMLDPTLARSRANQFETDYFLKMDDGRYLGEVYADHDFMEDHEEDGMGSDRTLYDAYTDRDEDGWSAFSELRYSTFKMGIAARFISHLIGEEEVKDYPTPVIQTTLRYNGDAVPTNGATVVVEAYAGNNLQKAPTASWNVKLGDMQTRYLYLGKYENRVVHGTLTPGHVLIGLDKVQLQMCFVQSTDLWSWTVGGKPFKGTYDEMWKAYSTDVTGTNVIVNTKDYSWDNHLINKVEQVDWMQFSVDNETQKGDILLNHEKAGTIDAITGDFSLDLSKLGGLFLEGKSVAMEQCFFRIKYETKTPELQMKAFPVSLAAPDKGTLKEGVCAFTAYLDLGNDGYTPGTDPIGYVKDVQVGWDKVTDLVIEMTDKSQAAGERFAVPDGASTIRVIRTTVNGQETIG